ncbi:unnamed protein product, partial [Chrysoparadoxa australica]
MDESLVAEPVTATFTPADLTFYYNLTRHMPRSLVKLPFARKVGVGIAVIFCTPVVLYEELQDKNGSLKTSRHNYKA